jgi:hypothetical protein
MSALGIGVLGTF